LNGEVWHVIRKRFKTAEENAMNVMRTSGFAAMAIALTTLLPESRADDAKPPATPEEFAKALTEAGKPGSAHSQLQPLIGSWSYTCKMWMDPSKPPMETKGTIERKWILGDRFIEEKVSGTGFDGKPGFEGLGLIGYDNGQKKFTYSWMCNMGTGTCSGVGAADMANTFTFQTSCYCPVLKKTINGRDVVRVEGPDKVIMESYKTEDGKEFKMMELVSVRNK